MTASPAVTIEYTGKIAIVTLDKPKKLNSLSHDDYYSLTAVLREIARKDEISVTLLIGKGRFFSAGADIRSKSPNDLGGVDIRRYWLPALVVNNIDLADAFYSHPKILVTALNGPFIGLSAALVTHSDLIFATPEIFLLTPFSSLGIVTEGGSSIALARRMGLSKAKEALLFSRRISIENLKQIGFVNQVLETAGEDEFKQRVLEEIHSYFGDNLNSSSVLEIKKLLREPGDREFNAQAVKEFFGGLRRFAEGIPQAEFEKIASGAKKHKL
ncbi:ClpP/crotonase-like domain-containing protein [Aspergillus bertholletiae]|uniref:ClpP/crotonase-like domain-containing protein n=1 Tax=Aspergillus bertholletiae TaxID=1226010 RepID=A0A5N7AZA2_9EURO|nr:ClpP/crotonase-like domain-containing protein [Aspergillus bertholletiae]